MSVLRGTKSFYDYEMSDILSYNIKTWIDYGLIEMGAYTNVKFSNTSTSGLSNLKRVFDDRNINRVFEGMGPSWIWESGVAIGHPIDPPIQVSGIYINNDFYPIGTSGQYSYKVDYNNGRVVFDNAVPANTSVKCEYSFRDVGVYLKDSPQWKIVVNNYEKHYEKLDQLSPSGMASILKQNRVWMPSIFVEAEDRTNTGLQLGGGLKSEYAVIFHILSDKPFARKKILDVLGNQQDKVLSLFDNNTIDFPLNFDGTLSPNAKTYPELSDRTGNHFITYAYINKAKGMVLEDDIDMYPARCVYSVEIPRYNSTF